MRALLPRVHVSVVLVAVLMKLRHAWNDSKKEREEQQRRERDENEKRTEGGKCLRNKSVEGVLLLPQQEVVQLRLKCLRLVGEVTEEAQDLAGLRARRAHREGSDNARVRASVQSAAR